MTSHVAASPRHAASAPATAPSPRDAWRRRALLYGTAFLLPVALLYLLAATLGVYPFGAQSFLTEDLKYQYVDFFHWYRRVLTGQESLLYSFSQSLGNNAWGLWSYYLASPLNLIILLFPEGLLTLAIFVISAVKLGLVGVTTSLYLRRRFSLGRSSTLALSLCFACSLWSMTQLRNPLWMDAAVLLPLVALGAWRCVTSGRWGTLAASLVASIVCCWYMGYMTVLFAALCGPLEWVVAGANGHKRLASGRAFARFCGAFCFTVLLSAWTLYPTVAAQLGNWSSSRTVVLLGASGVVLCLGLVLVRDLIPARVAAWVGRAVAVLAVVGVVAYVVPPTIQAALSSTLENGLRASLTSKPRSILASPFFGTWRINLVPQLFAGSLPLLGALCLLLCRRISRRARLAAVLFLAVLLFSSTIWMAYLIWCGFRTPNGFYCRNSLFFVFAAIWATGLYLSHRGSSAFPREVLVATPALAAVSTLCSMLGPDPSLPLVLMGDCLLISYGILLLPLAHRIVAAALPTLAFMELLASAALAWPAAYANYAQAAYDTYYETSRQEIDVLKEHDDGTYRVEKTYTRAGMAAQGEGLALGFNRIGSYCSSYNANAVSFLNALGYSDPVWFSVAYRSPVLPSDTLLGVRYVFSRVPVNELDSLEIDGLADGDLLYENPDALSLGYASSADVTADAPEGADPFETQNWFASSVAGREVTLYRPLEATLVKDDDGVRTWEVTVPAGTLACSWIASTSNVTYLYEVDDDTAEWADATGVEGAAWDNARFSHAVRMLGDVSETERTVTVSLKSSVEPAVGSGALPEDARCIFYGLNMSAYEQLVDELSQEQLDVTTCAGNVLEGTFASSGTVDGLLLSVPYDTGWTITLDGSTVEAQPACGGALTYVPVDEAGAHELKMSYVPPMLVQGTCVTLASAVALLAMRTVTRRRSGGIGA